MLVYYRCVVERRVTKSRIDLLIPLVAASLAPILGYSSFWVNDDVGIQLWLSGAETGKPEFRNPVLGPIFGVLAAAMYGAVSSVPWYSILLVLIPLLILYAVLGCLRQLENGGAYWTMMIAGSTFLFLLSSRVNYTYSAFLSSALAWAYLLFVALSEESRKRNLIVPILVNVLALSLRSGSSPLGLPIPQAFLIVATTGLLLISPQVKILDIRRVGKLIVSLCCVIAIATFASLISTWTSDGWRDFLEFYEVRGSLNGTQTLGSYLESKTASAICSEAGMTSFSLSELNQFELYDAVNVTNENLNLLREKATIEWHQSSTLFGLISASFRSGVVHLGSTGVMIVLLAAVMAVAIALSWRESIRVAVGGCLAVTFLATVIGYTSLSARMPVYVLSGVAAALFVQVISLVSLICGSNGKCSRHSCVLTLLLPLSVVGALIWHLASVNISAVIEHDQQKRTSLHWRQIYQESALSTEVILAGAGFAGLAFQAFPFDGSVTDEYRSARIFEGGSNLRSPQSLERWKAVSRENDTYETLFSPYFYTRVAMPIEKARQVRDGLVTSGRFGSPEKSGCIEIMPSSMVDLFRLEQAACKPLSILGTSNYDQSDVLWTVPTGSTLLILPASVGDLEFSLLAPFGEYATDHLALVERRDVNGVVTESRELVVPPGTRLVVRFGSITDGDQILVLSKSRCVIPFEIDSVKFPDRRNLCVGISDLKLAGQKVEVADTVGEE